MIMRVTNGCIQCKYKKRLKETGPLQILPGPTVLSNENAVWPKEVGPVGLVQLDAVRE